MTIKKVAIAGASGTLGPKVLASLVDGPFAVTVLSRTSSKAQFPSSATVARLPDDFPVDALADALRGQDALVITLSGTNTSTSKRLIEAAVKAGVRRVVPADWGSGDSADEHAQSLVAGYAEKAKVRAYLQELAAQHEGFSWTSIVNGHFFDWGLEENFFHFDIDKGTADIFDDGNAKWSTSTFHRVGEAVVKMLRDDDAATRNRMLYIQSFCVSQNDILAALKRQTGRQDWSVTRVESGKFLEEQKRLSATGDEQATLELVLVHGILESNWTGKPDFAMELLGLQDEDLDEQVRRIVDNISSKRQS